MQNDHHASGISQAFVVCVCVTSPNLFQRTISIARARSLDHLIIPYPDKYNPWSAKYDEVAVFVPK